MSGRVLGEQATRRGRWHSLGASGGCPRTLRSEAQVPRRFSCACEPAGVFVDRLCNCARGVDESMAEEFAARAPARRNPRIATLAAARFEPNGPTRAAPTYAP